MSSLNKIILVGNLTNEPEQKATNAGDPFTRFSLVVTRPAFSDGARTASDYIQVVAWRDIADKASALHKGQLAMVEGRIITRTYDDEDGKRHYITEVEAKEILPFDGQAAEMLSPVEVTEVNAPTTVASSPSLETKSSESPNFDFGELPESLNEEIEEDIPF